MPTSDGSSRFPVFAAPPKGNHQRSPGYVPGRVAPVRSPLPAKAPPPPPIKPHGLPPQRQATFILSEDNQRRECVQSPKLRKNTLICFGVSMGAFFLCLILVLSLTSGDILDENCPDHNPSLSNWNPGHQPEKTIIVGRGNLFRLESSATFRSLKIQSGGRIVFADKADGSKNITLRTHHILIENGGALHIGAPKCRYRSRAVITLTGRSDSKDVSEVPIFGRKFIGVMSGGSLELHGTERISWSLLTKSVPASGLTTGGDSFQRNFSRGINLRVVDQDTADVLLRERYDTHESRNDSRRLTRLLRTLPMGRIVALAVGDSAVKSLLDETKKAIEDTLGSSYVSDLKYRQAWALVSVVGGGNASCSEDVREHENHDTGGRALARRNFTTVNGVHFSVTAYSEWKNGFPISGFQVDAVDQVMLNLQDEVQQTWQPGDQIVVASTDYSMHQAEEFTLLPCPHCTSQQVRIQGKPLYNHVGEIVDGVDMRAEVALLSRNILIYGEMENSCYGNNLCQFYSHDTYGGHIKIFGNFSSVHLSYVELKNMGQQGEKSHYPIHFHKCGDVDQKGGYWEPTYVDGLSIHHSFSRCLTVHATNGLLIKNTVGYDTLGHCFFLEDGIEQRNTFYHNLGLLTRPGTLLPTDRNDSLCLSIKDKVYKGYTPSPSTECKAVSTFWIANPNNNLINNAAAGSQDAGIWFVFHSSSTGDSHGLVPETKAELTPLGIFYNNRVHSNFKAGLFIDKGVKTTNASAADPREYLCLDNNARFRPHQNADPNQPRVAAVIDTLLSFKNNDMGAWIRGGDIVIQNSGFADNGVGLSFASDGSYPKDEGSSQEVTQSLFVGESQNRGTNGGQNKYWGLGGTDGKMRTLPRNKTFPIRGFQIYDGPVRLTHSTFRNFIPLPDRYTSAVGFSLKNTWQLTPRNNMSHLHFHSTVELRSFFGRPGQWFDGNDLDGDKNSIFHDVDGSVTGYEDTYVGRADNYLIQHPRCVNKPEWNGVICSGRFSQVYIQTQGAPSLTLSINRDEYPNAPLVLRGINSQGAPSQQYQPVLMMSKSYTLHWSGAAPREVVLSLINFDKDDWVLFGLCYPPDTTFQIMADINDRQSNTFDDITDYGPVFSLAELESRPLDRKYYFDQNVGLLWLYLRARHNRDGHSYCSLKGCERVKVTATTSSQQKCNCTSEAYPKYAKPPSAVLPMPAPHTESCKDCGAKQHIFTSEPWTSYLKTQVKSVSVKEQQGRDGASFIAVNEDMMPLTQPGYLVVSVDACSGKVIKKVSFGKMDAKMKQHLTSGIPKRSIVLMATRGQPEGLPDVAPYLVSFGLAKAADLHNKESVALWAFHGSASPPPWVCLKTGQGDLVLGHQERYLPLALPAYDCPPPASQQTRRDLQLLKRATGLQ
ncbi:cell surface hyaluronidase isoform X1 [Corythoichthys intestinalis]|uniref:cell surface hyaluronidase isoform X1 n=1 Tax=Corythoichthys intestinalis TaxID=161448 RepID=UPI0025A648F3|nr:cell surface hyaluronidase isoform X1 [Corythoichthys intestinalis]XP_061811498.1 cell surface hyaluronidase-like [Nerophis lumbriciformis]